MVGLRGMVGLQVGGEGWLGFRWEEREVGLTGGRGGMVRLTGGRGGMVRLTGGRGGRLG